MTTPADSARAIRSCLALCTTTVLLAYPLCVDAGQTVKGTQSMSLSISATVDFGQDVGQNLGSLFQARDAAGKVVAGAGYLGAFNTDARSDRHALQVFVKPPGVDVANPSTPRPWCWAGWGRKSTGGIRR